MTATHKVTHEKPLIVSGLIGNSRMLATLDCRGEIHRLFWPRIDYSQNVDRMAFGLFVSGTDATTWLHDEPWRHHQAYEPDTNILITEAKHPLGLGVVLRDFVLPDQAVLVRLITVANEGPVPREITALQYSALSIGESPLYQTAFFDVDSDAVIHYRRNRFLAVAGDLEATGFTCTRKGSGGAWDDARDGMLNGRAIDNGDTESALSWHLGIINPGESRTITVFLVAGESTPQVREVLTLVRRSGAAGLLSATARYWREWLGSLPQPSFRSEEVAGVYRRSLLVFPLLSDATTGGVIAAPEFDPEFRHCGGYSYVWGRDAAYVTVAMDRAGLHYLSRAFYRWAFRVQEPDGHWIHRYYTDGSWGPSWGLIQIDETGSILYGLHQHYLATRDESLVEEVWPGVERAAEFLVNNVEPNGLPGSSVDLWEEREGQHTYSCAAVYGGLLAAAKLARQRGDAAMGRRWEEAARRIQSRIEELCWDGERGHYVRGLNLRIEPDQAKDNLLRGIGTQCVAGPKGYLQCTQDIDPVLDTSLLGVSVPFGVVDAGHPRMEATARALLERLTSPRVGGLIRYEEDPYRQGNPWILCTLWLGLYRARIGDYQGAAECLDWALKHRTDLDLLPEQVDKVTGQPAWVVPLTWSHAMFVLLALELAGKGAV